MLSKYKFNLCVLAALCIGLRSEAQIPTTGLGGGTGVNLADHMLIKYAEKTLYGDSEEKIEGSPYLSDEFVTGDIYAKNGMYSGIVMRYNIYEDYLEFKQKNVVYILDPNPNVMRKATLGDLTLVLSTFEFKGKPKHGLFILLDSGRLTLLEKRSVQFRPKQEPKAIETTGKPAKYLEGPTDFYYQIGNDQAQELNNLKKFIAALPDHQDEMTQFAKEKKISSNKGYELTMLIRYYNQLE
jgi:hypothetical protein